MTVPVATSRSTYVGNGAATVFGTGFYFLAQAEVVVRLTPLAGVEVVQTLGVHYTVTNPAAVGANGSITMLIAPPAASSLVIERTVPYTQVTSFRTQGSFDPAIHENRFDEQTFIDQQLARRVSDLESAGAPGSVIAGNGLSFAATTLHVGAGLGIQVNADTVDVLYGNSGQVVAVTKAVADGGALSLAARIDHKHDVSTAAPAAGAVAIGNAAAEGAATSLSRSDHVHAVVAPAAPGNVDKSAASAGAATTFARADHKHDVSTAAAIDLTDATNAEGAATTLARSNHTHSHGARGGGTLHAIATGGANGFMSAADKALLDALVARSHASARTGGGQVIVAAAAAAVLVLGTEDYDTGNEYNPVTYRFTASIAGYYHFAASLIATVGAALAAADSLSLNFYKNGALQLEGPTVISQAASGTRLCGTLASTFLLAAADYIEVRVSCTGQNFTTGKCYLTADRL